MATSNVADALRTPAGFRKLLFIDTANGPKPLDSVLDDWQRADFRALDDGWKIVTRRGSYNVDAPLRAYLERPRGHSKTADLAVMCAWALATSERQINGVAAAADRDQAKLLRDALARLTSNSPWLARLLDVQAYRVVCRKTGSTLDIISADADSSYGITPDFVIVDELTHWGVAGEALWTSLFSSVAKKPTCMLVIIANAGTGQGTSWQWDVREAAREAARTGDGWYFNSLDGPCASWISEKHLAEQRRMLPAVAFDRLWLNKWTSGSGDALTEADILRAVTLSGEQQRGDFGGAEFFGGVDIGIKRDASAICLLGAEQSGDRSRLARMQTWIPTAGEQVDLMAIEERIVELDREYGGAIWHFDPWQAELLAARLIRRGVNMVKVPFVGANLQKMATAIVETFSEGRIELYDDPLLLADLRSLRVVEKSYGFRLEAGRNAHGHADRAVALSLALLGVRQRFGDCLGPPQITIGDPERIKSEAKRIREVLAEARKKNPIIYDDDRPAPGWVRVG